MTPSVSLTYFNKNFTSARFISPLVVNKFTFVGCMEFNERSFGCLLMFIKIIEAHFFKI